MDFRGVGWVVLDLSRYSVLMVQTGQITSNSYCLVFMCLWLGLSLERKWGETRYESADVAGRRKLIGY